MLISSLLFSCSLTLQAQTKIDLWQEDSTKIIELTEIRINSKTTKQQYLFNFYRANQTATIEEIMSRLPELSLVRRGAYGMEPAIRNFNGGQINVLIDGMRIHGACTDKMDPATIYIEPVNLENLQVQTAGNGILNGSSIGGTLNFKMAEPDFTVNKKLTGFVSSGYQNAAKSSYEAVVLNYASGKFAVRASGTYRNNQSYRIGGGAIIPYSQFTKVNYSFSTKYKYSRFTSIKVDMLADDGWNIGYPALPMDVGYAGARIAAVTLQHDNLSRKLYKFTAKGYVNSIRHFMDDTKRPNVPMHMDMPGYSTTYGVISEGEYSISPKQKLQFRADVASNFTKASMTMYQSGSLPMYMLTWPDNRRTQSGAGVSLLLKPDTSWNLQLNARLDFISYTITTQEAKDQLSVINEGGFNRNNLLKNGSLRMSKQLHNSWKLTVGFSFSERMPTASELYGFYLFNRADNHDYIGNLYLKKEQSLQAEVLLQYVKGKNKLQFSAYHSKVFEFISNEIANGFSAMTIGAAGVKTFINLPYALLSGAEANAFVQMQQNVHLVSTLRYMYANDNLGNPVPFIAPLKNITSLRYRNKKLSVQFELEAAANQKRFNVFAGENATKGYLILNARLTYTTQMFGKNTVWSSGVENMLDKNYWEHLDWGNISRPGRNIYVQGKLDL